MTLEFGLSKTSGILACLQEQQHELQGYGDALFANMRLDRAFLQLTGVSAQFLHYLLLAQEEKSNIRTRVVEHLGELSWLKHTRGRGHDPVGTKVQDAILKGWAPCWHAMKAAVEQHNCYIDLLMKIPIPGLVISLPKKLEPEDLKNLSEDHPLWQDVWWPMFTPPSLWEEEEGLLWECKNMEWWWIDEMKALMGTQARALDLPDKIALEQKAREDDWFQHHWHCPPLSPHQWRKIKDSLQTDPTADEPSANSTTPIILEWSEPLINQSWANTNGKNSSTSSASNPYEHVMANLDVMVEELGAVVIDKRDLRSEPEQDDVDSVSEVKGQ
ncbi:hypothetical protein DACRYDRAFT_19104 [Dacryopinax primogenitus]|uniref:Uncharacterized protein n=1 Tax=Dacryopinax primogenitus (strain DJM 731) TaxID=1858805 RepID=M5FQ83_DACPD|nr:uncharacterized protein DACRYDRAFT_19104 [Dacryopinax primogenitus]EJT96804.1 hypothetical protein DACRYDRAFT_19104 [Dacryopinax primogenitus]